MTNWIWEDVCGGNLSPQGKKKKNRASRLNHKNSDVTFYIPAFKDPTFGGLKISFKWE